MPKFELYIAAEFRKRVEIEAKTEEEALEHFWQGTKEYTDLSDWEFGDMTYAERDPSS